jgi:hypothetical protein
MPRLKKTGLNAQYMKETPDRQQAVSYIHPGVPYLSGFY